MADIDHLHDIYESVTGETVDPDEPAPAGTVWVIAYETDPFWEAPGKYHRSRDCAEAHTSKAASRVSVGHAENEGYTACGRCC